MTYYLGVDLGQAQDYTASSLLHRIDRWQKRDGIPGSQRYMEEPVKNVHGYDVEDIRRWELGTPYHEIVQDVKAMLNHPELYGRTELIVDATGVGVAVVERMREEGLSPIGIIITGGHNVTLGTDGMYRVPKRDLVVKGQLMIESWQMRFADIPEAKLARTEFENFKLKLSPKTGNDTYDAWRDSIHDDIVLSVLLPLWYAEITMGSTFEIDKTLQRNPDDSDWLRHGL